MRSNFKKILCAILAMSLVLTLGMSFTAIAEEIGDFVVSVYNEESGLPTGEANDILQTSDGYIWIGSYGGLIRYDGSEFKNFSTLKQIGSSSIRSIFEDSKDRLWIGTNDAGVYLYEDDCFKKIKGTEDNDFLCVRDFCESEDGRVFCASNSGLAEIKGDGIVPLGVEVIGHTLYSCAVDKNGDLWSVSDSAVHIMNLSDFSVESLPFAELDKSQELSAYSLTADNDGNIIIGTSENTIVKYDAERKATYISTNSVNTHNKIRVGKNGEILVCGLRGFAVVDSSGEVTEFGESEKASSVNSAICDYEGNYWLASSSYGVIKYVRGCIDSPNNNAEGLSSTAINAISKQNGYYYVGHDSGLMVYDESWRKVSCPLEEMLDGVRIRHILADSNDKIWLATYSDNAVICYDTDTKEITVYNEDNGLISNRARVIYETSDKMIVVGTQLGISYIKDGKVTKSFGTDDGIEVLQILSLCESSDGAILAGSDGGGIYKIKDDKVLNYSFEDGLQEGVVLRMIADASKKDAYFVSAGSNLYYFENEKFRKLDNLEKGAGSIFDLYDKDGKLWILQNSGIFSVDKEKLLSGESGSDVLHGLSHGLTGSLNANTWHYVDDDGSVYLATRNGISHFGFAGTENGIPKIIVNSVIVDEKEYQHPTSMQISSDSKRITVDFSVLSFTDTAAINVSYKLDGFESEETILENQKNAKVSYTNLPGGSYTFVLKIYDASNPEKVSEQRITIVKEKKIYEYPFFVPLFIILVILVTALAVMLIVHRKLRAIAKREREYKDIMVQGLETLARTIDAKDKYTNGHSIRVAIYSRELARRMGMSEKEQEKVYYIALVHDIGKIGIPDAILNKCARLTDEEYEIIKTHPMIGGEILKSFTALEGSTEGASYHHEKYDGTGYGKQLVGEEIPLVARIIGVADAYDAMSSNRCYRNALSSEKVIDELNNGTGTQFDPKIVPFMLEMIEDGTAPIKPDATHYLPEFQNIV